MVAGSRETTMAEDVVNEGACAPFDLLSEGECAEVVAEAKRVLPECHWKKSLHEKGERCRAIAADERITSIVKKALGTEDVIVWGTYLVEKAAGQNHRWHADCESQRWETINAWIPLTNVGEESYMSYIPRSHKYPMQCQDVVPRGLWECDDAGALAFAKENYDENATIERWKDMKVGQVAIKNANCWHATINTTAQPRQALLLQYCSAEHAPVSRLFVKPDAKKESVDADKKPADNAAVRGGTETEVLWDETGFIPCMLLPGSSRRNPNTNLCA